MADAQTGTLATYVGTWTLDADATTIEFHTKAMWVLNVKGSFKSLGGSGVVTDTGSVSGQMVIDAASVDTGTKKRDQHLLTADFFDVAKYPTFVYAVTGSTPAPNGKIALTGTFTAHGQTHPLDLVATASSYGQDKITIEAEGDLDRTQWGLNWTKMGAGTANHLVVTAIFKRQ